LIGDVMSSRSMFRVSNQLNQSRSIDIRSSKRSTVPHFIRNPNFLNRLPLVLVKINLKKSHNKHNGFEDK